MGSGQSWQTFWLVLCVKSTSTFFSSDRTDLFLGRSLSLAEVDALAGRSNVFLSQQICDEDLWLPLA
jgi:hypothetical protein